jgi:hypothetical protein
MNADCKWPTPGASVIRELRDIEFVVWYIQSMKITVEISESEMQEICRVTGQHKKGPAIRKLVTDALQLKRREHIVQKFISGECGVELKGWEEAQVTDQQADSPLDQRWSM